VWYDPRKEPGKRVSRVRVGAKDLDRDRAYTLVVSDFMATGGSGFRMLVGSPKEDLDVVDVDALTRYLGVLRAPVEAPDDVRFHRTDR
jgi:2',3'-cyclic-nucleotide 2'-phosphodiesterase (5'-nucleotidase family)